MSIHCDSSLENKNTYYPERISCFQTLEEKIEEFFNKTGVFQAFSQEYCKPKKHTIKTCSSEEIASTNAKILYKRRRKENTKCHK